MQTAKNLSCVDVQTDLSIHFIHVLLSILLCPAQNIEFYTSYTIYTFCVLRGICAQVLLVHMKPFSDDDMLHQNFSLNKAGIT